MSNSALRAPVRAILAGGLVLAPLLSCSPLSASSPGSLSSVPVHLETFLPPGYVTDGSVDYTLEAQAALDAAACKTLLLPNFPILVSRSSEANWCLLAPSTITIQGGPRSVLREVAGAVQILRAQNVDGIRFEGFALEGIATDGHGLAHGLLQVTGGRDVLVRNVYVRGSDADGIAIANVENVLVTACHVENASKSSIYLSDCTDGIVTRNVVEDSGGHTWSTGLEIGAGIQLSGNERVTCADNVVTGGIGMGILVNAFHGGRKPFGCIVQGNRITGIHHPTNPAAAGGIRCSNGSLDKLARTVLANNSITDCGANGILIEGHNESSVLGNTIVGSERSGIFIGAAEDVQILGNVILNSGAVGLGQEAGIYLDLQAVGTISRGNVIRNTTANAPVFSVQSTLDFSATGGHSLEPNIRHGHAPPIEGSWSRGDIVYNALPAPGGYIGWVCLTSGHPGVWSGFGRIE